jgi:P-type Mg2+ transporter
MLWVFHAHAPLFRSGWFVESLATQSLVIFAIRTRRTPFFHSRPSRPLLASTLTVVAVGVALPFSPLAHTLGFTSLPGTFLAVLAAMAVVYLALIELVKWRFYRSEAQRIPTARTRHPHHHRLLRRASRWTVADRMPARNTRRRRRSAGRTSSPAPTPTG